MGNGLDTEFEVEQPTQPIEYESLAEVAAKWREEMQRKSEQQ